LKRPFAGRSSGFAATAMSKPVAIVAAMRTELAPLLRGATSHTVDSVELYELSSALVAIGGIGRRAGERAAEVAVREGSPKLLVSAGLAGALSPTLRAGTVLCVREVIDQATGELYRAVDGDAVLVTAMRVTGIKGKKRIASECAASAVDMEGAAVAMVAKQHGIGFAAVKAISDELEFPMPPVNSFVDKQGRFRTAAFAGHVALRPKWWLPVMRLGLNSRKASKNLAKALEHLISQHVECDVSPAEAGSGDFKRA
jgi:adenosylhomocysteine nucleosidase